MKRVFVVVILVVVAAILGLWRTGGGGVRQGLSRVVGASEEQQQGDVKEEIRKSFELQPGARVDVMGINGKVHIQTSDTTAAEVYVQRTAGSRDALNRREVTVEQTPAGLLIKARQVRHSFWQRIFGSKAAEEVTIKAPRQIALTLKGINGRVVSGDIDGSFKVSGVNGRVDLGHTNESADISGINGNISVGFNKLAESGVRVKGINGGIELRLAPGVNADLDAKGMNGNVRSDIPEVTVEKEQYGSRYWARIGSGGAPITISGVNGNVRLTRANLVATDNEKKTETKVTKTSSEK